MSDSTPEIPSAGRAPLPGQTVPFEATLDGTLGVQICAADGEEVVAKTSIDNRHRQPFGLVHGGFYALVGESTASIGGTLAVTDRGEVAMGTSNNTAFVRPFTGDGVLTSTARRIHLGRTSQLWDVEHRDDQGRLCATSRVTLAIRPHPGEHARAR